MSPRRWSKEDLKFLLENQDLMSIEKIAESINRSVQSVKIKYTSLKVSRENWHDTFIYLAYPDFSLIKIAEYLKFTRCYVKNRLRRIKYPRKNVGLENLVPGFEINELKLIEIIQPSNDFRKSIWKCLCSCGNEVNASSNNIRFSLTNRCPICARDLMARGSYKGYKDLSGSYWENIKRGAGIRGISIDISIKYAWDIFEKQNFRCSLTGRQINLSKRYGHDEQTASLDRINSDLAYTEGNIQWIHKDLQPMKMRFTQNEFIDVCKEVVNHNLKTNHENAQKEDAVYL